MSLSEVWSPRWWELLELRAARTPDLPMLVDNYDRQITFGVFRDLALRVAAGLAERGIGPGSVVSWQLPAMVEAAVLSSALARLGCTQNPIIPVLRDAEVDFMVGELGTHLLIVPEVFRGFDHHAMANRVAARHGCEVLAIPATPTAGGGSAGAGGSAGLAAWSDGFPLPLGDPAALPPLPPPPAVGGADAPAGEVRWVFYSSGTTGFPKGARHTDASVIAGSNAMQAHLGFDTSDVASIAFPLAHIGGPCLLSLSLRAGCRVILIDVFDPAESPKVLGRHGSTMLGSATPHFHAYLNAQTAHGAERLFPRLRFLMAGGAPAEPGMHDRARRELGGHGLMNGWGLTEFPMVGYPSPGNPDERLRTTVGRPGPGVRVRVVGPDGEEVPRGTEGELRVTGPQLFAGYTDPALDAEAIDALGYLRTGDLGIHDSEGWLYITGRLKDVIVRNAENISALEVENVLLTHPAVVEAAAVGLPDPRTGERCVAFVVLAPEAGPLSLAELAGFCRDRGLAPFKIPEQLETVEALPRNAMGKVQKKVLREGALRLARTST